jgi:prevent-host-death family protein
MYNHITLKDLRPKLPKVIQSVDSKLDRFVISKNGIPVAVLLSIDDFESLIETLNEESDSKGLRRIRKAMQEVKRGKTVNWNSVKKKLGL